MANKMVVMLSHGYDAPERVAIAFVLATAAQASGHEVVMCCTNDGVTIAKKGIADHVVAPNFPPIKTLLETYLGAGGTILACAPCTRTRNITEADLVEGAKLANATMMVKESMEATSTINC